MSLNEYLKLDAQKPTRFIDLCREDEFLLQVEIPPNCPKWRKEELVNLFVAELRLHLERDARLDGLRLCAIMKHKHG